MYCIDDIRYQAATFLYLCEDCADGIIQANEDVEKGINIIG